MGHARERRERPSYAEAHHRDERRREAGMAEHSGSDGVIDEIGQVRGGDMGRKSHGTPGQGGKMPTKPGKEGISRSLLVTLWAGM
jgi:hypothetical protein